MRLININFNYFSGYNRRQSPLFLYSPEFNDLLSPLMKKD